MSSKPILSLIAALALTVAGSTASRAQSTPSDEAGSQSAGSQTNDSQTKDSTKKTKKKNKPKKHPGMTKLDKLERGNPASVYYKSRKKHAPNPTNSQIDAAETNNPHHVTNKDRDRMGTAAMPAGQDQMASMDHEAMMQNATPTTRRSRSYVTSLL